MVGPLEETRPGRPVLAIAAAAMALLPGCGLVPKSRMDECHRVTQTLRAENSRLKDVALDLRTQNQDLSQRAVDDARQIAAKDEANERLVKSVHAYQSERDKLASAFEALERQVRMALNPHPAARPERLKAFATAHPGWSFDEATLTLSAPPGRLFDKGSDALKPEAASALTSLATELSGPGAEGLALEVVGPAPASPVVAAGFDPSRDGGDGTATAVTAASGRFLDAARAARVRDRLAAEAGFGPSRVRLSPAPRGDQRGPDGTPRRVEIRLKSVRKPDDLPTGQDPGPKPPALDAAPGAGR
ncbi:MAG: hypothetical protein LC745_10615 [Planctomycetia bacterium]|nr:hypothetical protein [Planctomycetia bacterium]